MVMMEVELKLQISHENAQNLHALPWLLEICQYPQRHHLFSAYYDTEELLLQQHGAALRVRQNDKVTVQTLKFKSDSQDGLTRRKEIEWPLQMKYLDYAVLEKELPEIYSQIHNNLKPIFITEFVRTAWLIEEDGNSLELALDQGEVRCGHHTEAICELELELRSGDEKFLFAIKQKLLDAFELVAIDVSKAARGYRLHAQQPQHTP